MKIGELAELSRTPPETIRYYEREGLLPAAPRTQGNYRVYGPEHAERLNFIRHCRSLDMALDEIHALLHFKDAPHEDCTGVNDLLDAHIGHIAQRIRELKGLEKQLKVLRSQCEGRHAAEDCEILRGLSEDPLAVTSSPRRHVQGAHR